MFQVKTVSPGFYWLKGYMPKNTLSEPDIANAFIFEKDNNVYLIDTGAGVRFKSALQEFFRGRTYKNATLINTHWHVDHVCNNDILNEIEAPNKKHIIHPGGIEFLNILESVKNEALETSKDYFPADFGHSPLGILNPIARLFAKLAPEMLFKISSAAMLRKFEPVNNKTSYVAPLSSFNYIKFMFGKISLSGWENGDLILFDDQAHSSDSIVVYEPVEKILLPGDLTYEYNPLWRSGTYQRTITNLQLYRTFTEEGYVEILGDSHNHQLYFGTDKIISFLDNLIETHQRRRKAILDAASKTGASNVESIRNVLIKENPEFAKMVAEGEFPLAYRSSRAMISVALSEQFTGK